jgi:hypothetical protein
MHLSECQHKEASISAATAARGPAAGRSYGNPMLHLTSAQRRRNRTYYQSRCRCGAIDGVGMRACRRGGWRRSPSGQWELGGTAPSYGVGFTSLGRHRSVVGSPTCPRPARHRRSCRRHPANRDRIDGHRLACRRDNVELSHVRARARPPHDHAITGGEDLLDVPVARRRCPWQMGTFAATPFGPSSTGMTADRAAGGRQQRADEQGHSCGAGSRV